MDGEGVQALIQAAADELAAGGTETGLFCTGPGEQKAVNLRGNPHVTLTTGCNTWHQGLDVVVEGDAVRVTEAGMLERLAAAWATKWTGQWQYQVRDGAFYHDTGTVLVYAVRPSKVLAFGKGNFSHTRHRFTVADGGG